MSGPLIIGAGAVIRQAVARRFGREGLPVALIARHIRRLRAAVEAISPSGVDVVMVAADSADEAESHAADDMAEHDRRPHTEPPQQREREALHAGGPR
ncbi:hypothetical protein [Nonomuraea sp. bgisy101]|uniref:hypothetical protein n=1 Tax=Nonomuraea sp. bgisy101 TaxID=3413784 RepID=UPI003D71799E